MNSIIALVEIPATNFERAKAFYESVFQVEIKGFDSPEEKMGFFPSRDVAISFSKDIKPSKDGTLISFQAFGKMDKVISRIMEHGGTILKPKTNIEGEGMGSFALFEDTEGNRVGLHTDPD